MSHAESSARLRPASNAKFESVMLIRFLKVYRFSPGLNRATPNMGVVSSTRAIEGPRGCRKWILKGSRVGCQEHARQAVRDLFGLSLFLRWPRQCNPVENLADKKVSLNGGQVFSHDLIVEPQAKQASRVAWNFKLNDDPLD
jgi:hypothetical protein